MTSKNDDIPSEWMYRAPLYVAIGVGTAATAAAALPILGFTTGLYVYSESSLFLQTTLLLSSLLICVQEE